MPPPNNANTKAIAENRNTRTPNSKTSPAKSPNMNGVGRSPSLRGSLSRPGRGGTSRSSPQPSSLSVSGPGVEGISEDEAKAEYQTLLDEMRERLRKVESAYEESQQQVGLMQTRLDESQQYHNHLEDQLHAKEGNVQVLEAEKGEMSQKRRDLETLYESERAALFKEKEEQSSREVEMQDTIRRLKDSLSHRGDRPSTDGQATTKDGEAYLKADSSTDLSMPPEIDSQFAPPSSPPQASSEELVKAVATKERVIKSLRLELAECQIKIMEIDSIGGGNVRELEKKLVEIQIENARLQEDNESFQLLLSEKTLNGEFSKSDALQSASGLGSLAEELGSDDLENVDGQPKSPKSDSTKRMEIEINRLMDQNKALSLYIEKIIGRLLQHKDFETIFDKDPSLLAGVPHPASDSPQINTEKELPPPPPQDDTNKGPGFLQRAGTVIRGASRRPRPLSQIQTATEQPLATPPGPNENPSTAPSIPLGRTTSVRNSHKRTNSDMPNAAPIVNQMYRGPSPSGLSAPLGSPGLSPAGSTAARNSFFSSAASNANPSARVASGGASRTSTHEKPPGSSSNSTFSEHSGGVDGSPPRTNNYPGGAVMTQSRLRPLRLVQENKDEDGVAATAARKKANRTSWMPQMPNWMAQRNGGGDGP